MMTGPFGYALESLQHRALAVQRGRVLTGFSGIMLARAEGAGEGPARLNRPVRAARIVNAVPFG